MTTGGFDVTSSKSPQGAAGLHWSKNKQEVKVYYLNRHMDKRNTIEEF